MDGKILVNPIYSEMSYEDSQDSPPYMKKPQDGADVPLLNAIDYYQYCQEPTPRTNSQAWRKLVAATTLCLIFMVIELVGGYIAGSLAVMTDAAHLLSDCVGFLVGLSAVWLSGQPPTNRFTYGYHRAEVLGALLSISVIWILTGIFIYLAVERLVKGDFEIHSEAMLIVSAIGIAINITMGCVLHSGHTHDNINVKAAVVHVIGDLIQSCGVFISAVVIKFYPSAKVVDPLCTFLCCLLVMSSTVPVLRDSVWVLLEGLPPEFDYLQLHSSLSRLEGVVDVHSLHIWALSPAKYIVTAHLAVGASVDRDQVLDEARSVLQSKFNLEIVTLQIERSSADVIARMPQ